MSARELTVDGNRLLGRRGEAAFLEEALDDARLGRARALVIRGDAGIGKTSLLEQAVESAVDFQVLRCSGVDIVERIDHAGLYGACRPLLDRIGHLPPPQRAALGRAFALDDSGGPTDALALGVAVLTLLADAAEDAPLLLVVDDAHWLDEASLAALSFAAHRFQADCIACLFATRARAGDDRWLAGLETLPVGPLAPDVAAFLLDRMRNGPLSADDRRWLLLRAAGNPLALRELARATSTDATARWAHGVVPVTAGAAVERRFAERFDALPSDTRLAATIAAAGSDLAGTAAALGAAGLSLDTLEPAERAALLRLDAAEIAFVHPLARSAAYAAATAAERRAGHRAHAEALAGRDEERRAWHLGAASDGYDAIAAEALERAGAVATRRGQHGVAAAALHRSARLTEPLALRARRLLAAARAMESTSMPTQVADLLDEALAIAEDPELREVLVAQSALTPSGRPYSERLRRARRAAFRACGDPGLAARALREAVAAASALCRPTTVRRLGLVAVARAEQEGSPALRAVGHVSLAWGYSYEGNPRGALVALNRAANLLSQLHLARQEVWTTNAALNRYLLLGDSVGGRALAGEVMELARARGQSFLLARALDHATIFDLALGEWDRAAHEADELLTLAEALGAPGSSWWRYMPTVCNALEALAVLAALRGDPETPRLVAEWGQLAAETELGDHDVRLQPALATFELALGEHEACIARLEALEQRRCEMGMWEPQWEGAPLLVEAFATMGRTAQAHAALDRLHARLDRYTSPTLHAQAARAAALLAPEDAYEQAFQDALELHDANVGPFERARTLLLLGERRRRSGCMLAAREPLRTAARTFGRLRAQAWLERAQAELLATGEKRRSSRRAVELTPQERRIADLACEGRTNREIASALFLSPKTVEYHLGNAYRKLGVRSRTELARRLSR